MAVGRDRRLRGGWPSLRGRAMRALLQLSPGEPSVRAQQMWRTPAEPSATTVRRTFLPSNQQHNHTSPYGGRAAFKSISRAGLAHKKVTFAGFWISHKMCVAISSIGHTEVAMSLDQSGQLKNPFPAISSSRGGSSVEGDRRTTGRGASRQDRGAPGQSTGAKRGGPNVSRERIGAV